MMLSIRSKKNTLGVGLALLLVAGLWAVARAAPLPPRIAVNHGERQCAMFVTGDECGDAILPEGWEYQPPDDLACPEGYSMVDLRPEWQHFKAPFCCMEGHSGVAGDCQDVVINRLKRQCAFVEDIEACSSLPLGWAAWGKDCPAPFTWTEDVACKAAAQDPPSALTALPLTAPALTPTPVTPLPVRKPLLPCFSFGALLTLTVGIALRRNG
jgi:hypothetical protein